MNLDTSFLGLPDLHITDIACDQHLITMSAETTSLQADCPQCGQPSSSVHSSYIRSPRDLPLSGKIVRLRLLVRRFRCRTPTCSAQTFAEPLPQLLRPHAQRTIRFQETLRRLAFATGGEAGAQLTPALGMTSSASTLLRLMRATFIPTASTPSALGVDEFAWQKGQTYGTLLVDLTTHRPIDMLPDRSADSFAAWLQHHPGVEIISRDRSGIYADGASRGAPQAIQVADRFHLLMNLRDAITRLVDREASVLKQVAAEATSEASLDSSNLPAVTISPDNTASEQDQGQIRRQKQYDAVHALHAEGNSIHAIVRRLGISRNTVRRYLRSSSCPINGSRRPRRSLLDRFEEYLQTRWEAGCRNSAQLWRELRSQGFKGSQSIVRDWAHQRRCGTGLSKGAKSASARPLSSRRASWLMIRPVATLTKEEHSLLDKLLGVSPALARAYPLAQEFGSMVRERRAEAYVRWQQAVQESNLVDLQRFALGLRSDESAVLNALQLEWSNGSVQGAITRLKLIKRAGYGRMKFDLLRKRVLYAA